MIDFICPVCKKKLSDEGKIYRCENNHCFDRAKSGYVNLLMSNASSKKHHGDDRLMVKARRDFLSKGYYSFLLDELSDTIRNILNPGDNVIDAGCGECYYSGGISADNPEICFAGIDISKSALEYAGKRGVGFPLCVASVFDMPFENSSASCVISCFSPDAYGEYRRVLRSGGFLLKVVPLEDHLFSLKEKIYDEPYLNESPGTVIDGFETLEFKRLSMNIHIENSEDISNLFKMTPYYYKTGRECQQRLEEINELDTQASFGILLLKARK